MLFPDVIVPSQWSESRGASGDTTPEQRLHQALLLDAVHQLNRYRASDSVIARQMVAEVEAWIREPDDPDTPINFRTCCETGFPRLDPDAMREALLKQFRPLYMRRNFVANKHRG